jgi:hypothetical protein
MTPGRVVRNLALFLGLSITILVLSNQLFPFPAPAFVANRLNYLESHSPGFDIAFIGSSATLRGVDPHQFDEAVEHECRLRVHSINLGVRGADGSFIDTLVAQALRRRPNSLKWTVLEARAWNEDIESLGDSDERAIWLHSASNTYEWILDVSGHTESAGKRFEKIRDHVAHMAAHYLRIGQGPAIIHDLASVKPLIAMPHRGAELMNSLSRTSPTERERRRRLLEDLDGFKQNITRLSSTPRDSKELSTRERDRLKSRLESAQDASLNTMHFLVPNANERARKLRAKSDALTRELPNLVAFDDPENFPALFEVEKRWDRVHLNDQGAKILSIELAKAFCKRFGTAPN